MVNVMISIHPKYVENMKSGKKRTEVRKSYIAALPTHGYIHFYIYETRPVCKVIGDFLCDDVYSMVFNDDSTCLTDEEFNEYKGNKKHVYGYEIYKLKFYDKPKELAEFGLKRAPQSWCYIRKDIK